MNKSSVYFNLCRFSYKNETSFLVKSTESQFISFYPFYFVISVLT